MFGYVTANGEELSKDQQERYRAVYCGICRCMQTRSGTVSRLSLSYDMAFLALLLMSLYEPEENSGKSACLMHPVVRRSWVDNEYVRYAADMNVALAYYNCLDDWQDDGKRSAKLMAQSLGKHLPDIEARFPRQCQAISRCIGELDRLERENCPNPDLPAGAFGELMGELLVYREDLWAEALRGVGMALGRFIYLLDAAIDYEKDEKKHHYNPYLAKGNGKNPEGWEEHLLMTMGRATKYYELLPLVQDKALLDNILYSGVWIRYRAEKKKEETK